MILLCGSLYISLFNSNFVFFFYPVFYPALFPLLSRVLFIYRFCFPFYTKFSPFILFPFYLSSLPTPLSFTLFISIYAFSLKYLCYIFFSFFYFSSSWSIIRLIFFPSFFSFLLNLTILLPFFPLPPSHSFLFILYFHVISFLNDWKYTYFFFFLLVSLLLFNPSLSTPPLSSFHTFSLLSFVFLPYSKSA